MNTVTSSDSVPPAENGARKRKGPPLWGVVAFLVLLGAMMVVNQMASSGGPEIAWVDGGLDAAIKQVSAEKPLVFAYLYEADDPAHKRNELRVFSQRWARDPLSQAVCCRIALNKHDPECVGLFQQLGYRDKPLFLVLDKDKKPVMNGRTEGAVSELEFFTYVSEPIRRSQQKADHKEGE